MDRVVWNLDARNRPELEVEIVIERSALPDRAASPNGDAEWIEGEQLDDVVAHFVDGDNWFVDDGTPIEEMPLIHSAPPQGYSQAYRLSAWRAAG
jgi:hypothetical protein